MQKNELEQIKRFILDAPLAEMRHGIAKLIDYIINKEAVTPKGKSQKESNGNTTGKS